LNILSGVRVHPELSTRQTHSGHLVLQCRQLEGTRDYVMQQQLERKMSSSYLQHNKKNTAENRHSTGVPLRYFAPE
jgi:hypothetical protein